MQMCTKLSREFAKNLYSYRTKQNLKNTKNPQQQQIREDWKWVKDMASILKVTGQILLQIPMTTHLWVFLIHYHLKWANTGLYSKRILISLSGHAKKWSITKVWRKIGSERTEVTCNIPLASFPTTLDRHLLCALFSFFGLSNGPTF